MKTVRLGEGPVAGIAAQEAAAWGEWRPQPGPLQAAGE